MFSSPSFVLFVEQYFSWLIFLRALASKRKNNLRMLILLMILCFELEQLINVGALGNQYLYLRVRLDWDISTYTKFCIVVGVVAMFAHYIAIPLLSEKLHLRDSTIVMIDITGCLLQVGFTETDSVFSSLSIKLQNPNINISMKYENMYPPFKM